MGRSKTKVSYSTDMWNFKKGYKKPIWTKDRKIIIEEDFIGKTVIAYSGIKFYPIKIKESIVGLRLGSLSIRRKNNTKKLIKKGKR